MSDAADLYTNFPQPFYFNGELMPKWSAQWHWLHSEADEATSMQHHLKLDQMTGIQLSIIENRLELLQRTDSEDPLLFRLCSQHILHWMLTHEDEAKQCIASHIHHEPYVSATSEEVYTHLVQGISQMIHLVHRDGIAFWRNGCVQEQQYLVQDIQRHRLPADHPEHFKAPHLSALEKEQKLEIQMTLKNCVSWRSQAN